MAASPANRIPSDDLRTALRLLLGGRGGSRVVSVRRRRSAYSSSHEIDNLDVRVSGGKTLPLVVKDLGAAALLPAARRVRPEFLYDPGREIRTYARVLEARDLGTPHFYGAIESADPERYWLFLERVQGTPLWQSGEMAAWEGAARWVARLQLTFGVGRRFRGVPGATHLVRHDADFFRTWADRALAFVRRRSASVPAATLRRFARLVDGYELAVARLVRMPLSLVHGEFYPSNILVRPDGTVCPVDWELAAVGPAWLDIAALVSGEWTEAQREAMVAAYRGAMAEGGVAVGTASEAREAVDCCQLQLAVQWLGWAADWSPPDEHAQDWLREALRLAGRLGIG